jgi:hypothetical protein
MMRRLLGFQADVEAAKKMLKEKDLQNIQNGGSNSIMY